ncbi:hypothetical protein E2C01_017642 [Portunus trituberculatus]|uniref:Uncharacterized protein n=1 Tax=Portunus trituberculatus TaxID=210409 RepID=A0A5B7DU28_PORTR|nr:hypothetical protein [Portunus trituberculatus]
MVHQPTCLTGRVAPRRGVARLDGLAAPLRPRFDTACFPPRDVLYCSAINTLTVTVYRICLCVGTFALPAYPRQPLPLLGGGAQDEKGGRG